MLVDFIGIVFRTELFFNKIPISLVSCVTRTHRFRNTFCVTKQLFQSDSAILFLHFIEQLALFIIKQARIYDLSTNFLVIRFIEINTKRFLFIAGTFFRWENLR